MVHLNNHRHMSSLRKVFLLEIQEDVDLFAAAWNNHIVRLINEDRRYIAGHVPKAAFKDLE